MKFQTSLRNLICLHFKRKALFDRNLIFFNIKRAVKFSRKTEQQHPLRSANQYPGHRVHSEVYKCPD